MELKWYTSESTICPKELELDISPTTVYFRRNIQEEQRQEEWEDESHTVYVYEEAILPKIEYASHLAAQNEANIDYIAVMSDIEL